MNYKNRRGIFYISHTLIDTKSVLVKKVMSKVVVTRAESLYDIDAIRYYATSHLFRKVSEGEMSPEYEVVYNRATKKIIFKEIPSGESLIVGVDLCAMSTWR